MPRAPRSPRRAPTVAEVRARVEEHARTGLARRVDATYNQEIAKYKTWVEGKNVVRDGKYLTRDNVDWYFTEVQQYRLVTPNTGRRVVSALQHYASREEYAGAEESFVVESATVITMLQNQKQRKTQHNLEINIDYHLK